MPCPITRFVLIEPSHAGNVGAAARAMKVMGFDDLVLVAPRHPDVLTCPEALARASGADDVLARARVAPALDEALGGITHLCATAMTPRDFGPPTRSPREHFALLLKKEQPAQTQTRLQAEKTAPAAPPQGIAFLFGSERFGLSNADVYRCHVALSIPTAPGYGSLNLAAAVQLIAYEWRQTLGGFAPTQPPGAAKPGSAPRADAAQVAAMLEHWRQSLEAIGFLDAAAPKKLMPRLAQLSHRAQLRPEEIHILRGIAKAMLATARQTNR